MSKHVSAYSTPRFQLVLPRVVVTHILGLVWNFPLAYKCSYWQCTLYGTIVDLLSDISQSFQLFNIGI